MVIVATGRRLVAFELHVRAGRLIRRAWAPVRAAVTALAAPTLGDQELIKDIAGARSHQASFCMFVAGNSDNSAVLYEYWPDARPPSLKACASTLSADVCLAQECSRVGNGVSAPRMT